MARRILQQGAQVIKAWEKLCPICERNGARVLVNQRSAIEHLPTHGMMFRMSREVRDNGLPESDFDELAAFHKRLTDRNK